MINKKSGMLPPCGMLLGSPIYLPAQNYLFQRGHRYSTRWVPEDKTPWDYLNCLVKEKQGNCAVLWDEGTTSYCLASAAFWHDMRAVAEKIPLPDWQLRKNLTPADWPLLVKEKKRYGAGLYSFTRKAASMGIYTMAIYADAFPSWISKAKKLGKFFLGLNVGEAFSTDILEKYDKSEKNSRSAKDVIAAASTVSTDLQAIRLVFQRTVSAHLAEKKKKGWPLIFLTSASFHIDYEAAAGGDILLLEDFAFCHLNMASAISRGLYKQYQQKLWGSWLAHEHYSFLPYSSTHKFKMLTTALYLKYMSGAKIIILESGNWWQQSNFTPDSPVNLMPRLDCEKNTINPEISAEFVTKAQPLYPQIGYHSPVCRKYRKIMADFYQFILSNGTPQGQPEVTMAAVKGNLDGCGQEFNPNVAVWNAYQQADHNPLWLHGAPEKGWELLKNIFFPRPAVLLPYHNRYFSGTPFGQLDIVSFSDENISAAFLQKNYHAAIFLGWNTMTRKHYNCLKDYVTGGGTLFISIAHFSRRTDRNYLTYDAKDLIYQGELGDLCGVRVKKRGEKFYWAVIRRDNSLGLPLHRRYGIYYAHGADIEIRDKKIEIIAEADEGSSPLLLRRTLGKGFVYLLCTWEYPGAMYWDDGPGAPANNEGFVGDILRGLAADRRGTVYITDDGRQTGQECGFVNYACFPEAKKIFLLNIDFRKKHDIFIHVGKKSQEISLRPLEFKELPLGQ